MQPSVALRRAGIDTPFDKSLDDGSLAYGRSDQYRDFTCVHAGRRKPCDGVDQHFFTVMYLAIVTVRSVTSRSVAPGRKT